MPRGQGRNQGAPSHPHGFPVERMSPAARAALEASAQNAANAPRAEAPAPVQLNYPEFSDLVTSDASAHIAAIDEFVRTGNELGGTIARIVEQADQSIDQQLAPVNEKLSLFRNQVYALPPLDQAGRDTYLAKFGEQPEFEPDELKKQSEKLRQIVTGKGRSSKIAFNQFAGHIVAIQQEFINLRTRALKTPWGYTQKVELAMSCSSMPSIVTTSVDRWDTSVGANAAIEFAPTLKASLRLRYVTSCCGRYSMIACFCCPGTRGCLTFLSKSKRSLCTMNIDRSGWTSRASRLATTKTRSQKSPLRTEAH